MAQEEYSEEKNAMLAKFRETKGSCTRVLEEIERYDPEGKHRIGLADFEGHIRRRAPSETEFEAFLVRNKEAIRWLGVLFLRLLDAELVSGKREPSKVFVFTSARAQSQDIDLDRLFQEVQKLGLPPLHDGFGFSVLGE